jgi:hypothetical protein
MLEFLWKWKVSTTAALSKKFYPARRPQNAYKRLWELEKGGFIQAKLESTQRKSLWTLTRKGFQAIQERLPELKEEGTSRSIRGMIFWN